MDIEKERKAFDQYFKEKYPELYKDVFDPDGDERAIIGYSFAWSAWQAKAQAVLEEKGRSDFEIIAQTIELVDLIAESNCFQRDKSMPFTFESNNPRSIKWWRLACKIQELLTDTDPNNCDFEEYKAMIEAQEPVND